MASPSPPVPDSNTDVSLNEAFERFRQQTFDRIKSCEKEVRTSKHHASLSCKENERLEALVAEKDSELDALQSKYKQDQDISQQEYANLQATSQQLIDKLQKEIVGVTAQKDKAERKLGVYAYAYHQTLTPPKALAENGSDASEEQPVDESATSGALAVSSSVASPPAEGRTSLQNEHFKNSGNEGEEEVVEDEPSAFKKSEDVAGDEDTSSPPASPSKKSEEDVLQDDSDQTATPKNSDDEGEEFDENEPSAKEEEEDKDVEEDAKDDVEEDEEVGEEDDDGKNVDTLKLLPIAEDKPVEIEELKLTTPEKSIEDKSDDDDGFATPFEDMGEVTTQDTGTQTPPRSLRKSKRCSKTSPKKTPSSTKKQKRAVRNQ